MPVRILASRDVGDALASRLSTLAGTSGRPIQVLPLDAVNEPSDLGGVEIAFFSRDMYERSAGAGSESPVRKFFSLVGKASSLKWLHIFSAGADRPIYADMAARGVRVTTSAGANSRSVALMALTGLLALNRQLPRHLRHQGRRAWHTASLAEFSDSLEGQKAVVVGTGHVGADVARLLKPLGLRLIGLNRQGRPVTGFDEVLPVARLADVVPDAAWLILCCPLSDSTRRLVDARILNALPVHAHVINVARGGVIDEPALIQTLQAGRIAGAHLDVFDTEPLPVDSPLWAMDNVIVTPHAAAHSREVVAAANDQFIDNMRRWLAGAAMRNVYAASDGFRE